MKFSFFHLMPYPYLPDDFDEKYAGLVTRLEYEELNSVKNDWTEHATNLVSLAEKIAESRRVLVVMSYSARAPSREPSRGLSSPTVN